MHRRCAVLLLIGSLGLGPAVHAAAVTPVPAEIRVGHCDDLDAESLVAALEAELPKLLASRPRAASAAAPSPAPALRFGGVRMRLAEYAHSTLEPLLALARRGRVALCAALPREFVLHRLATTERGHFSAYFHPLVPGSRTRHGPYQFPLYRRPPEPASQLTTGEILGGRLDGQGLELAYLDSLGTALNVHIEGSATVQLDDGSEMNLTTDGNNGHPYSNPFKLARQDGIIPDVVSVSPVAAAEAQPSPAARRSKTRLFFDQHPELLRKYWAKNPHFVFFKPTPLRGTGRFGQLVAGRSVAVDAARVPLGSALWLRTELASAGAGDPGHYDPIARLALAQDTGAAIRGSGRVDIFVGSGAAAQHAAAFTSRPGELYLIVHKSVHKPGRPPRKHARKHARKPHPVPAAAERQQSPE